MYPAIKPGTTPKELLPELGHTSNTEGKNSSVIEDELKLQKDIEALVLKDKKNK